MLARAGLGLIAVQRADVSAAEALSASFQSRPGGAIPFLPLSVDRLLGMLAVTAGRLDTSEAHFDKALEFCRRAGYRPELAWTASEYAGALHRRGRQGDEARAVALDEESLAIARELRMRPLMERVLARRPILRA